MKKHFNIIKKLYMMFICHNLSFKTIFNIVILLKVLVINCVILHQKSGVSSYKSQPRLLFCIKRSQILKKISRLIS